MTIVPVHPQGRDRARRAGVPTRLADVPGPIDVVDMLRPQRARGRRSSTRRSRSAPKAVWLQLGVVDEAAAARATAAGLDVVMDTCPAIEAPRLGLA